MYTHAEAQEIYAAEPDCAKYRYTQHCRKLAANLGRLVYESGFISTLQQSSITTCFEIRQFDIERKLYGQTIPNKTQGPKPSCTSIYFVCFFFINI
jgi:hypothetical protein